MTLTWNNFPRYPPFAPKWVPVPQNYSFVRAIYSPLLLLPLLVLLFAYSWMTWKAYWELLYYFELQLPESILNGIKTTFVDLANKLLEEVQHDVTLFLRLPSL